jgi:hypothetical protein
MNPERLRAIKLVPDNSSFTKGGSGMAIDGDFKK